VSNQPISVSICYFLELSARPDPTNVWIEMLYLLYTSVHFTSLLSGFQDVQPHSTANISDPILNIIKSYSLPKPLLTEASAFDGERPYVMATWGRYMKPVLDALPSGCASLIEAPSVPHAAAALMFMVGWAIMHPNDDHDNIDHRAAFHAAFSRSGIRGNVTFVPLLALLADNRQYDM
jgi:hypothetical protein